MQKTFLTEDLRRDKKKLKSDLKSNQLPLSNFNFYFHSSNGTLIINHINLSAN